MLQKLENQPTMTVRDMQRMFPNNWFRYAATTDGQICAVYIAGTRDELLTISALEMSAAGYIEWGDVEGENLIPAEAIEIGGLEFAWSFND